MGNTTATTAGEIINTEFGQEKRGRGIMRQAPWWPKMLKRINELNVRAVREVPLAGNEDYTKSLNKIKLAREDLADHEVHEAIDVLLLELNTANKNLSLGSPTMDLKEDYEGAMVALRSAGRGSIKSLKDAVVDLLKEIAVGKLPDLDKGEVRPVSSEQIQGPHSGATVTITDAKTGKTIKPPKFDIKVNKEEVTKSRLASEDNWIHRSDNMKCQTCMWYVGKGSGKIGRCRFGAPTIKGWPAMFPTDWCGQHKLDENKI